MKIRPIIYFFFMLMAINPFVSYFAYNFFNVSGPNFFSLLVFLTFLFFYIYIIGNNKKLIISNYLKYFIIFIIYTIISDHFLAGKSISIKYIYSNRLLDTLFALILIENTFFTKKFIRRLKKVIIIVLTIAFFVIFIQGFYSSTFFVNPYNESALNFIKNVPFFDQRLNSIYTWEGNLGIGFCFLPMFAVIFDNILGKRKFLIILSVTFGLFVVFLNKSRWVFVNYLIIMLIPFFYYRNKLKNVVKYIIIGAFSFIIFISFSNYLRLPLTDIIQNRFLEKQKGGLTEGSASTRILAFYVFWKLYPQNPILGKGALYTNDPTTNKDYILAYELGGRSSQIHVGYLQLLYTYGAIGFFLYIGFLYLLLKRLYYIAKKTKKWGPLMGILGFAVANLTLVSFSLFYSGLVISMVFAKYYSYQQNDN